MDFSWRANVCHPMRANLEVAVSISQHQIHTYLRQDFRCTSGEPVTEWENRFPDPHHPTSLATSWRKWPIWGPQYHRRQVYEHSKNTIMSPSTQWNARVLHGHSDYSGSSPRLSPSFTELALVQASPFPCIIFLDGTWGSYHQPAYRAIVVLVGVLVASHQLRYSN